MKVVLHKNPGLGPRQESAAASGDGSPQVELNHAARADTSTIPWTAD